uniref:Uncharacterized protein n=1 Tax=Oryza meridionalis TaxID=40149 RepID=A0A0E0ETW1_9ORYZ
MRIVSLGYSPHEETNSRGKNRSTQRGASWSPQKGPSYVGPSRHPGRGALGPEFLGLVKARGRGKRGHPTWPPPYH